MLSVSTNSNATIKAVDNAKTFRNMNGNDWCVDAMAWLAENGVAHGEGKSSA